MRKKHSDNYNKLKHKQLIHSDSRHHRAIAIDMVHRACCFDIHSFKSNEIRLHLLNVTITDLHENEKLKQAN